MTIRLAALTLALLGLPAFAPPERGIAALRDPARLVQMGREKDAQGDTRQAMSFYDLAIAADPGNIPALTAAGENALRRGNGQDAYAYYTGWARADPKSGLAQLGIGTALVLRLMPADALPALSKAEALGAPGDRIGMQRGVAYDLLGDFRSAQVAYAGVLANKPGDIESARRLALSLAVSGSRPAALQVLRRFEADDSKAVPLRQTMAMVYALTGDPETADEIAGSILAPDQARAMAAFFTALPGLSPHDKMMAALFGRLPNGEAPVVKARPIAPVAPPVIAAVPVPKATAASPERLWVQVANVSDPSRVASGWVDVVKSGKGLADLRNPRVWHAGAGNKLLIGPFASRAEANAAVLRLKAGGVAGFPLTTPAGAEVSGELK